MNVIMMYAAIVAGGLLFLAGFTFLIMLLDARKKSKARGFVLYAKDGLENNFTSNHTYGFCSAKGIRVTETKDGKLLIQSQSRLVNTSFLK